ncbi:hypothetical protein SD70_12150 [Gordoniibacillus kamchatkensis]|uniref:Glycosyltransferase 2-like domain-containing protein n=1 Tax=Gordoniibacillus kamchatkensis TaxID=1590651 RepID=A0ABR5AI08_9BACL|nr:glycosyltransferase [Paenibacillus sp. VKM B-2647]KIL40659.1 hypothetical protein SD70_12150 [Paenibacillus sp. VKM B-2647]
MAVSSLLENSGEPGFQELSFENELINTFSKHDNLPLVSIIIRTCNRLELLRRCLHSINMQIYPNIEVVVVNDGGDDVNALLKDTLRHPYIYISHSKNFGRGAALNSGLRVCRGEYVNFLDDDDMFMRVHIAVLMKTIMDKNVDVVYGDAIQRIEKEVNGKWQIISQELLYSQKHNFQLLLRTNYLPIQTVMFKRDLLFDIGLVREDLSALEDWEFWIRLAAKTDFHHVKLITSEFSQRIYGDNITQNNSADFATNRILVQNIHQNEVDLTWIGQEWKPLVFPQNEILRIGLFTDSLQEAEYYLSKLEPLYQISSRVGFYIFYTEEYADSFIILEKQTSQNSKIHFKKIAQLDVNSSLLYQFHFILKSRFINVFEIILRDLDIKALPWEEFKLRLMADPIYFVFASMLPTPSLSMSFLDDTKSEEKITLFLEYVNRFFSLGNYEECERLLKECLEVSPRDHRLWHNCLILYVHTGKVELAGDCFKYLNESDKDIQYLKALWLMQKNDLNQAIHILENLHIMFPEDEAVLQSINYMKALT